MSVVKFFFLCAAAVSLCSCQYGLQYIFGRDNTVDDRVGNLLDLTSPVPAGSTDTVYTVAIISDAHYGGRSSVDEEAFLRWMKVANPKFVISLGDSMDTGGEDEAERYVAFTAKIKELCEWKQVYSVIGNHDVYNSGWKHWRAKVFPYTSFYRFKTKTFSWYFVDTGSGTLGKKQFGKLKRALVADPNPKIVLTHYPLYTTVTPFGYFQMQNTEETDQLITYFHENNVKIVYEGHTHTYETINLGKVLLYNVPSINYNGYWAVATVNETAGTISTVLTRG